MTQDRLDLILESIPEDFLAPREIDLLNYALRFKALTFEDHERFTFSREYFYEIPVIEHIPWFLPLDLDAESYRGRGVPNT